MKIAVFDTYIRRPDGRRMHFDILVDDANKELDTVLQHGKRYLNAKGLADSKVKCNTLGFNESRWSAAGC